MSLSYLEIVPYQHGESFMAIYHESTHGLIGKRPSRTTINKMVDPYFAQIRANNERAEDDPSFDAHAANLSLYHRILESSKDAYKRSFETITQPIREAADRHGDEVLRRDYEKIYTGYYVPNETTVAA